MEHSQAYKENIAILRLCETLHFVNRTTNDKNETVMLNIRAWQAVLFIEVAVRDTSFSPYISHVRRKQKGATDRYVDVSIALPNDFFWKVPPKVVTPKSGLTRLEIEAIQTSRRLKVVALIDISLMTFSQVAKLTEYGKAGNVKILYSRGRRDLYRRTLPIKKPDPIVAQRKVIEDYMQKAGKNQLKGIILHLHQRGVEIPLDLNSN